MPELNDDQRPHHRASVVLGRIMEKVAYDPAHAESYPLPWWAQNSFRLYERLYGPDWRWIPYFYDTKEWKRAFFSCNDIFRYWSITGVGNYEAEALVGQAGELEVYNEGLGVCWHLYTPKLERKNHFLTHNAMSSGRGGRWENYVSQRLREECLPIIETAWQDSQVGHVRQTIAGLTVGPTARSVASLRFTAERLATEVWLVVSATPFGPHGWCPLPWLGYNPETRVLHTSRGYGMILDQEPDDFGVYGNGNTNDWGPDHYTTHHGFAALKRDGRLNRATWAEDRGNQLCMASFAWRLSAEPRKRLTVRVPLEQNKLRHEEHVYRNADLDKAFDETVAYWKWRLFKHGAQLDFPSQSPGKLAETFRLSRAYLRLLSDEDKLHPGPSVIYNKFWVRDSAVEAVAAATAGDMDLAERQFLNTYRKIYPQEGAIYYEGPWNVNFGNVPRHGYFGGPVEVDNHEWDGNGLALWAMGRYARFLPVEQQKDFALRMYHPYMINGARWFTRALTQHDILPPGWSAEHLGPASEAHYWDDLCGLAGLYETARFAERTGCNEQAELWSIFDRLKWGTMRSIEWVLHRQRETGQWQTFVPSGPYDWGRADSHMVGSVAYYQHGRLHIREKLGPVVDHAMRQTLETIWSNFIDNGFHPGSFGFQHRDNDSWHSYGAYLTLQVAHAFLCIGDVDRMEKILRWCLQQSWLATSPFPDPSDGVLKIQAIHGAMNEQHVYPLATEFQKLSPSAPYVGDIPHGWSATEYILLIRNLMFMEVDEDNDPAVILAPGVPQTWFASNREDRLGVQNAPCSFGGPISFSITHRPNGREVVIQLAPREWKARFEYRNPFGSIRSLTINGVPATSHIGDRAILPADATEAVLRY